MTPVESFCCTVKRKQRDVWNELPHLRTGPRRPWLPLPMTKRSPDKEHSPPALRYAELALLNTTEEERHEMSFSVLYFFLCSTVY